MSLMEGFLIGMWFCFILWPEVWGGILGRIAKAYYRERGPITVNINLPDINLITKEGE